MSTPSERALILARREAAYKAIRNVVYMSDADIKLRIDSLFPLPPRVVPNVQKDEFGSAEFTVTGGTLAVRMTGNLPWTSLGSILHGRGAAIVAVITNPTISVPDDGEGDSL